MSRTHQPLPDERKQFLLVGFTENPCRLIQPSRFNSYWKLPCHGLSSSFCATREAAEISRGSGRLRNNGSPRYWIREVQRECCGPELQALQRSCPLPRESLLARFNPFLEDGLSRMGGRLQFADLSRKQNPPILLHGSQHFSALLIMQTHVRLHHLGVRIVLSEFRILQARQTIKKVLYKCLPCKIAKNPFGQEREAPMSPDRVTVSKPFQVTGIDFAGPLYVKGTSILNQRYIALFTATIRAVHLKVYSDTTTVGTTKRCLRKVLGRSQAMDENLTNTLVKISAALNSRPITQDTQDALTPAHFLCGKELTLPSGTETQM